MNTKAAYNSNLYINEPLYINSCGKRTVKDHLVKINRPNGRSDHCFIYVKQGQAHFVLDSKTETLSAGNFFLFRPNQPQLYNYSPEDKTVVFWLHFSGTEAEKILSAYSLNGSIFKTGVQPKFETYFDDIIDEILNRNDNYQDIIQNLLKNIIALISRYSFEKSDKIFYEKDHNHSGRKIYDIINYFDNHYTENINIEDFIKNKMKMSLSYFNKQFKTATNTTPLDYISSLRINNAKLLLENSELNITEISHLVGYNDPLYFSRYFKKKTGISPLAYRKFYGK